MTVRPQNWVFLGDSLTEGVGSARVSYVSELAGLLRDRESHKPEADRVAIHEMRLRHVNPDSFNRFVRVNTAGLWSRDPDNSRALWLWNFACEGATVETDLAWLPWLENLRPERVFIHRGGLESIVRPSCVRDGSWPWWVPTSWRGYAAMDPRCYFSAAPWRRLKQSSIDRVKQRVRLHLLARNQPAPLMEEKEIHEHLSRFLGRVSCLAGEVCLIGLLPVQDDTFPGSARQFEAINRLLASLARESGVNFLNPASASAHRFDDKALYYRDGFHPNLTGAQEMATFVAAGADISTGLPS